MGKRSLVLLAAGLGLSTSATALEFNFHDVGISFNNRVTIGAGWRVESRDPALVGKLNNDPFLCEGTDCITLSGDPEPNQRLVDAPGGFFADKQDDGNLNYDKGDIIAGLAKVTTDLTANWSDFTFKARVISFFDTVNYDFDEFHPNNDQIPGIEGVGGYQPRYTRRDSGVEDVYGTDISLRNLSLTGSWFLGDRLLSVGIGSQTIRWGESNLIALNSINEINPPDIRGLRQVGGQINEIFQPVPMLLLSGDVFPDYGVTAEAFYQFKWEPVIADAGGTLFGELDALYREGPNEYAAINLGQFPEDPLQAECDGTAQDRVRGCHRLQSAAAVLLTDTSFTAAVDQDSGEPDDMGQYGVRLNWFADMINNGTEFGFYAMNYHSRLPYLSFMAADKSPLRNGTGLPLDVLTSCTLAGNDCLPIDTASVLVDYPEDIHLFGVSFNTNIGSWSVAGEYAYRPNVPVQVSMPDIFFASLQPAFPENPIVIGVEGITEALGLPGIGAALDNLLGPLLGNVTDPLLGAGFPITVPGARTGAPDYLETVYRGNDDVDAIIEERGENYYIPGFERLKVGQFVLNGIKIFGSSDFPARITGSEQIIMLLEAGFTHVIDMPSRDVVQFDGSSPNRSHASCGADGTGNNPDHVLTACRQAEANTSTFNPTQQTDAFVDDFAWGYRALITFEYNDVFWGVNLKPFITAAHDVKGYAPAPQQNFLEDRIEYTVGTEWFLGQNFSGRLFYNGHEGNRHNVRRDKDNVVAEISYTF